MAETTSEYFSLHPKNFGYVEFAGWTMVWVVPLEWKQASSVHGSGLHIAFAKFRGVPILNHGCQPLTIANYLGIDGVIIKDGLAPEGSGLAFRPYAACEPSSFQYPPQHTFDAGDALHKIVVVEKHQASFDEVAHLVVWCKINVGNYNFIHRWEFHQDGSIRAAVGLGGYLLGLNAADDTKKQIQYGMTSHIHNFYFRLDFALGGSLASDLGREPHDGAAAQEFEVFSLPIPLPSTYVPTGELVGSSVDQAVKNNTDPGLWKPISAPGKIVLPASAASLFRVRLEQAVDSFNPKLSDNPNNLLIKQALMNGPLYPSYVLVPGSSVPPDGMQSTGDLWISPRTLGLREEAESVKTVQDSFVTDEGLEALGASTGVSASGYRVWYCLRHYHQPRWCWEEGVVLPYDFVSFELKPANLPAAFSTLETEDYYDASLLYQDCGV